MAGQKDLLDLINFSTLECLNENPKFPASNSIKQGYRDQSELCLESDADEQLLINIEFNQKIKFVQGITITGPAENGPKRVRLYVNRGHMGFSDVDKHASAQDLDLTPEQLASGEPIQLKMVKFNFVSNMSIFVESNQDGSDVTRVAKIVLQGQSGDQQVFDVAQIKKVEDK